MVMSKMGTSEQYRDLVKHFEGPNIENDTHFAALDVRSRGDMDTFVHVANTAYAWARKNGIPAEYLANAKVMREILKKENAPINMEATYALTVAAGRTIYESDVTSKTPIPVQVAEYNGGPRWAVKDYLVQTEGLPAYTEDFRNPRYISLKESSGWTNCIGLIQGWNIPWNLIQESRGGLWSPEAILMEECAKKMGVQRERTRLLGTATYGARADDGSEAGSFGITGLYNHASLITSFDAGVGDQVVTTAGDIYYGLVNNALPDLKLAYDQGPNILITTSGYASEPFLHRDGYTGQLDTHKLRELIGPGKLISGWWSSDNLYASAASANEQQVLLVKAAPTVVKFIDVYPMQTLPIAKKLYDGDLAMVMIWGGGVQYVQRDTTANGYGATKDDSVDSTGTGFIPNGTDVAALINEFPNAHDSPNY